LLFKKEKGRAQSLKKIKKKRQGSFAFYFLKAKLPARLFFSCRPAQRAGLAKKKKAGSLNSTGECLA
jgi:hypothetical protein